MRLRIIFLLVVAFIAFSGYSETSEGESTRSNPSAKSPNIIIILSDDQGWGDVGFNGCTDIPTPNLDALAEDGIVFTQGYVSHPYCSPMRAGMITGRYQHRFGHENNTPYTDAGFDDGTPLDELMISELLTRNNYKTCAIGKWHLGDHERFWPTNRGFDDWYGFFGGGMSYWGNTGNKTKMHGVLRDGEPVPLDEITYLTDDFSREAVNYISNYVSEGEEPFFMYLAYNAPHGPIHATTEYLQMVEHIENGQRAAYSAMVAGMDAGIGKVIAALKEQGIYENTLIFFLSDNGAQTNGGSSHPFRGNKGMLFEGGIRVPFLVSWPGKLEGGSKYPEVVSSLDIFPTIMAAAGIDQTTGKPLDGTNLIPYLSKELDASPHETLFWRVSDGVGYAVLHHNYKLVRSAFKDTLLLFDISKDPYEHNDISTGNPDKMDELQELYDTWEKGTVPSKWQDPHIENVIRMEKTRQEFIDNARAGEKKNSK